ncbi:hypothetical protein R1sor_014906 [Riccia sorocarpa]|uniref:BTB domain-containing protein n=1 Tax=Riccia sorocarpa TaxID=122646 RepID=A0ABD3HDC1_9MARC
MRIDIGVSNHLQCIFPELWLHPCGAKAGIRNFEKEESLDLVEHLMSMINNREFSDVTFLCNDGREVHASRMLLAARSEMFKKMLLNGMSESRSTVIQLPLVASSTLIQVFRYLYAGRSINPQSSLCEDDSSVAMEEPDAEGGDSEISHSGNDSSVDMEEPNAEGGDSEISHSGNGLHVTFTLELNEMVNVALAARFFLLERLEDDMKRRLTFLIAKRYHQIYTEDMLNSVAVGLSNIIALKSEKPTNGGGSKFFAWCRSWCLPSTNSVARFLRDGDKLELYKNSRPRPLPGRTFQVELKDFEILLPDSMTNNFTDLLAMVNLPCIHPDILLTVVIPSRIIDAEKLMEVLEIQALSDYQCLRNSCLRSTPNLLCRREWSPTTRPTSRIEFEHRDSEYEYSDTRKQETFYAATQMHFYGIYNWAIVARLQDGLNISEVDRRYPGGFQIGFYRRLHGERLSMDDEKLSLSENPEGWAMEISDDAGSAKFYCREDELDHVWVLPSGKRFEVYKEIEVKLNPADQVWSFSYDGSSISVVLRNLQGSLLYPGVSFQSKLLKVCIIFRGGFDQEVLLQDEGFKRGELLATLSHQDLMWGFLEGRYQQGDASWRSLIYAKIPFPSLFLRMLSNPFVNVLPSLVRKFRTSRGPEFPNEACLHHPLVSTTHGHGLAAASVGSRDYSPQLAVPAAAHSSFREKPMDWRH